MREGIQRHGAAVPPSPDRYAAAVELGILREQLIERGELVFQFDRAELVPDGDLKFAVAIGRAAIIHAENRITILRQQLMKQAAICRAIRG